MLFRSGYDPDSDPITYSWFCNGGGLSSAQIAQPTFSAPQVAADTSYTCTLTVTDNKGLSDADSMYVAVKNIVSLPAVETNSATEVQETNATINGYLNGLGEIGRAHV